MDTKILNTDQVAEIVGRTVDTLRHWRNTGQGPRWFRLGRRISYLESDLTDWIEQARQASASGRSR